MDIKDFTNEEIAFIRMMMATMDAFTGNFPVYGVYPSLAVTKQWEEIKKKLCLDIFEKV